MSAIPRLETQLNGLSESHKQTESLITELTIQTASIDSSFVISKIHESLQEANELLDLLSQEVKELPQPNPSLSIFITRLGEDLKHSRARFRAAQLSYRHRSQALQASERRKELFGNRDSSHNHKLAKDNRNTDPTLAASTSVTEALRRTHRSLVTEVEKSHFAQEILEQSQEELRQLANQYTDLDSLLSASKGLVSSLLTSTKSDTWYLETSFYLLIATLIWLVFRRFLYGPLWWFAWLPIKLLWRLAVAVFSTAFGAFSSSRIAKAVNASNSQPPILISHPTIIAMSSSFLPASPVDNVAKQEGSELEHYVNELLGNNKSTDAETNADKCAVDKKKDKAYYRGDGTKLNDSNEPRNPKKRMWEEKPAEKPEKKKDVGKDVKDEL